MSLTASASSEVPRQVCTEVLYHIVLPSFHPAFGTSYDVNMSYLSDRLGSIQAIPTQPNGGNHSPAFADSARTTEAHKACMITIKALACTGFRVLEDEEFSKRVCVLPCDDLPVMFNVTGTRGFRG